MANEDRVYDKTVIVNENFTALSAEEVHMLSEKYYQRVINGDIQLENLHVSPFPTYEINAISRFNLSIIYKKLSKEE